MQPIFFVLVVVGLVVGAGFVGSFSAGYRAWKIEEKIVAPWTAYDRGREIENTGFVSGAVGGLFMLALLSAVVWKWGLPGS